MEKAIKRYLPIFVLPTLAAFIIGFIAPFIMGVGLSFCEFTTVKDAKFVGISNYVKAFQDTIFRHSFWYTALFAIVSLIVINVCAFALALAMDLTQEQYATLLPKSVTTAISMDVAAELGGIAALTGAIVIVTGIVGALLAETVCKLFHITDPIAKGVGIGTAAHAVGTSKALQMGEVEGAMSGLSIAVAGVLTAVLCPLFVGLIH